MSWWCIGYDYMACMDYMEPDVRCPQIKAVKLTHSLTGDARSQGISNHDSDLVKPR